MGRRQLLGAADLPPLTRCARGSAKAADRWTARAGDWWDGFYADRSREVPFFAAEPDENLAGYLERGLVTPGRALDVGCGPGRNAVFLARHGFQVDAVDVSATAIE
ncbi:class I SAM-dependent methyltransferase [Lentzea jiangxiensis]|uniref:Tellurite resistance protein TehB n=1 Tax=Lentzea jiangxiensis TaxID=641025 RepID=A0A1H0QUL7_9PSEU|nr:methyltransferase domain-containing protein [Lentzea jiangxiensis]SDP20835.1 Tellurite resistance protein TehB [Lentzea jiangxiensis]